MNKTNILFLMLLMLSYGKTQAMTFEEMLEQEQHKQAGYRIEAQREQQRETKRQQLEEGAVLVTRPSVLNYAAKGILIFLDDSEREEETFGALSGSLFTALMQNAGPIIVSTALLNNLFLTYKQQDKDETFTSLVEKNKKLSQKLATIKKKDVTPQDSHEKMRIFLKLARFNPENWVIKQINNFLCLLIPIQFINSLGLNINAVQKYDPQSISDVELQIGLKVNHMKAISIDDIINQKIEPKSSTDYFINVKTETSSTTNAKTTFIEGALYTSKTKTSAIFVTRSEYAAYNKKNKYPQIIWAIFLKGHGASHYTIAGIPPYFFKKALDIFEQYINTMLLIYSTCYGAGQNIEEVYNEEQASIQKTYSFAIIVQALTDAPTSSFPPIIERVDNSQVVFSYPVRYDLFLFMVTNPEFGVIDYKKILMFLDKSILLDVPNAAQIKLPGVEWFSIMEPQDKVVSIGTILAKSRNPQMPLDVGKFFKSNPTAILLYAATILFELILNTEATKAIVSMIPGSATHTLKKISTTKSSINSILELFMALDKLQTRKIFFIGEINERNSSSIQQVVVCNNYNYLPDKYEQYAFFIKNNELFIKEKGFSKEPEKANTDQKALYQALLAEAQRKVIPLGSITINKSSDIKKLIYTSSCIVNKINTGPDITIDSICSDLREKLLASNAFVWIKEITGEHGYGGYLNAKIAVPNTKPHETVTLSDIIIDNTIDTVYFTYKNNFYKGDTLITQDYREQYKERLQIQPLSKEIITTTETTKPSQKPQPQKEEISLPTKQPVEKYEKVAPLGTITINELKDIEKLALTSSSIIEKIDAPTMTIDDVCFGFKLELEDLSTSEAFVWIKEMVGKNGLGGYPNAYITVPNVKPQEPITLNDVIIDETNKTVYFMYKNNFYRGDTQINYDYRELYEKKLQRHPTSEKIFRITKSESPQTDGAPLSKAQQALFHKLWDTIAFPDSVQVILDTLKYIDTTSINAKYQGKTLLEHALQYHMDSITVGHFIDRGARVTTEALITAMYYGDKDTTRLLIEHGGPINEHTFSVAIKFGRSKIVQMLINAGANVKTTTRKEYPLPLELAIECYTNLINHFDNLAFYGGDFFEITKLLIDRGAKITYKMFKEAPEEIRVLLRKQAEKTSILKQQQTISSTSANEGPADFVFAIRIKDYDAAIILFDQMRTEVNAIVEGITLLNHAIIEGAPFKIIQMLIRNGAKISDQDVKNAPKRIKSYLKEQQLR